MDLNFEKSVVPILSGSYTRIIAHIQNITQNVKAKREEYLPNVSFSSDKAIFYFQIYTDLKPETTNLIKKFCMDIILEILNEAKADGLNENIGNLSYEFESDSIDIQNPIGRNLKTNINYSQTWNLDI